MKILPISTKNGVNTQPAKNKTKSQTGTNTVSFKRIDFDAARMIENRMAAKGVSMNVHGNAFVAECYEKVIELFERLFKKSYLPAFVGTEKFENDYCLGNYFELYDSVNVNENLDYSVFYDMDSLKEEAIKNHNNRFLPNWHSTSHPAHTFVHEFSHAAHWHHLEERNGYSNARQVWYGLDGTQIPNSIGRLIAKFKISEYAVGTSAKHDMCEFMAERMTKDICGGLTDNMWIPYKNIDVGYSDIFSRKWNYRYSSPQSYIDYFTQQVWDGDIDGAKRVGDKAEQYLAELDADKVAPVARTVEHATEGIPILDSVGRFFSGLSRSITEALDDRNRIQV